MKQKDEECPPDGPDVRSHVLYRWRWRPLGHGVTMENLLMRHLCIFKKSVFDFTLRYGLTSPHPGGSYRIRTRPDASGYIWTIRESLARMTCLCDEAVKCSPDVRKGPSGRQGQFLCPGVGLL